MWISDTKDKRLMVHNLLILLMVTKYVLQNFVDSSYRRIAMPPQAPLHRRTGWIILHVFLPFMVAYLLSELYRNINAIVGPIVQAELGLSIAYLGWMTSVFLAAVAGAQVFTGIWLDRYGARRTVAGLLLVGALGAVLFASGKPNLLLLGRFLIGVGMAGCWTAAFKVNAQWWRPERLALANGMIIG